MKLNLCMYLYEIKLSGQQQQFHGIFLSGLQVRLLGSMIWVQLAEEMTCKLEHMLKKCSNQSCQAMSLVC